MSSPIRLHPAPKPRIVACRDCGDTGILHTRDYPEGEIPAWQACCASLPCLCSAGQRIAPELAAVQADYAARWARLQRRTA